MPTDDLDRDLPHTLAGIVYGVVFGILFDLPLGWLLSAFAGSGCGYSRSLRAS